VSCRLGGETAPLHRLAIAGRSGEDGGKGGLIFLALSSDKPEVGVDPSAARRDSVVEAADA
jgi:hypothetical protein